MKLVIAVVQDPDADETVEALVKAGFSATRIASTGGFLKAGNATLLVGAEDDRIEQIIGLIKDHASTRTEMTGGDGEARVGGAIVFVTPVDRFERA